MFKRKDNNNNKDKKKITDNIFFRLIALILLILITIYLYFLNQNYFNLDNFVKKYEDQIHVSKLDDNFIKENKIIWINQPTYQDINYFEITILDKEKNQPKIYKIYKTIWEEWKNFDVSYERLKKITEENKWWNGIWLQVPSQSTFTLLLIELVPLILTILLLIFLFKYMERSNATTSKIKTFSTTEDNKVSFEDIGWIQSEKEEIIDLVDTLKNIKEYKLKWIRVPRWVLLYWPPWVWKTMIAKAIASEMGIDMFIAKWSDFKSKWYWEWAKNVDRIFTKITTFLQAQSKEVAILFIDEIENLLKERFSWHSADDDIVNEFLNKIDGIKGGTNIILIWATNNINQIDKAALSRFDSVIWFNLPNYEERLDIIKKIIKKKQEWDSSLKVDENINLDIFASYTIWFNWRTIESILNKAHIEVAKKKISLSTKILLDIWEDVVVWKERKNISFKESDADTVILHEIWHWIIAHLENKRVIKLTNIPRWPALWVCYYIPKEEILLQTPESILWDIRIAFAWRIAEEVMIGKITTWASNDLEKIERMITDYLTLYDFKYKWEWLNYVLDKNLLSNPIYLANVKNDIKELTKEIYKKEQEKIRKLFENEEVKKMFFEIKDILKEKRNIYEEEFNTLVEKYNIKEFY